MLPSHLVELCILDCATLIRTHIINLSFRPKLAKEGPTGSLGLA